MPDRSGLPHFTHSAANELRKFGIPHGRETDDIVGLWQAGQSTGLVTAYRRGIAYKLTVTLRVSIDGQSVVEVQVLE